MQQRRHALAAPHGSRVTLLTGGQPLLAGVNPALGRRMAQRLHAAGITVLEQACSGFSRGQVHLAGPDGIARTQLACDAPIVAPRTPALRWLAHSGMLLDNHGSVVVNPRLQVESHRQVFIADDARAEALGPTLDNNLRCALGGGTFNRPPPPARRCAWPAPVASTPSPPGGRCRGKGAKPGATAATARRWRRWPASDLRRATPAPAARARARARAPP